MRKKQGSTKERETVVSEFKGEMFDTERRLSRNFLLYRQECCGMGCYNCPYLPIHEKGATKI